MASRAPCRLLPKLSPYIGPTRSGDIQTLAIALQQLIRIEYVNFLLIYTWRERIARHKIRHLKLSTRKLEDLHV